MQRPPRRSLAKRKTLHPKSKNKQRPNRKPQSRHPQKERRDRADLAAVAGEEADEAAARAKHPLLLRQQKAQPRQKFQATSNPLSQPVMLMFPRRLRDRQRTWSY